MCGIAAMFGSATSRERVQRMLDALAHRGPDDVGVALAHDGAETARGVLGHRRLAIIDLSHAGHQPMWTPDGALGIVFNGEIYNYRELRDGLRRQGVRFVSDSDTEVLLAGWRREGAAFLDRLRGMFAFVLWDRDRSTATLVRDPFGIKPLYVANSSDGTVLVASEVRAILAAGIDARLSALAMRGYLSTGSVPEPLTAFENVRALPAGTFVEIRVSGHGAVVSDPASYQHRPWWVQSSVREADPVRAACQTRESLERSIARHLVSDVPVAAFLSGGIDSSAVVALAATQMHGASLETFTVTFGESEFDESVHARAVADRFGTRHHEIPLTSNDLLAAMPLAFDSMDQPSLDGLNTFVVSRAVREAGIKVVLSGLGGDEMFGGYPSFRRARRVAALWNTTSPALRRTVARGLARGGLRAQKLAMVLEGSSAASAAYHSARALFAAPMVDALCDTALAANVVHDPEPQGLSPLQLVSWLESARYMRNTLLRDSDVFSMAHGLELRVPFLDLDLAAMAASIDDRLRVSRLVTKPLLVNAMRDLLPRDVWDRPKRGFTLPFASWMRGALRDEIAGALMSSHRVARLGLRPAAVRAVWTDFLAGGGVTWSRPWALYTLVRWAETVGASANDESVFTRDELLGATA